MWFRAQNHNWFNLENFEQFWIRKFDNIYQVRGCSKTQDQLELMEFESKKEAEDWIESLLRINQNPENIVQKSDQV